MDTRYSVITEIQKEPWEFSIDEYIVGNLLTEIKLKKVEMTRIGKNIF